MAGVFQISPLNQRKAGFPLFFGGIIKKREGQKPFPLLGGLLLAGAGRAVVPQLEGSALGLAAGAHAVLAVAHLDLVEGAALVLVVSAAVHGALDAGIGLVHHGRYLLVS
jgi:hypothetical protein